MLVFYAKPKSYQIYEVGFLFKAIFLPNLRNVGFLKKTKFRKFVINLYYGNLRNVRKICMRSGLWNLQHVSPHIYNQPHYCISPRKQLHDIKTGHITTVEKQKARAQQRNFANQKANETTSFSSRKNQSDAFFDFRMFFSVFRWNPLTFFGFPMKSDFWF